jgi:hydrogenase large subunit
MPKRIVFSPITRLSGLLSLEVFLDRNLIVEANVSSTMFRGFEWIMQNRNITDAIYMTQRVCGICSLAHGAVSSYLVDSIYDNEIDENAQYLRNIMLGADFLQNHIRHFYLFSIPDFVRMPDRPPFIGQNLKDARLDEKNNEALVTHYFESIKASQESHQILSLFGGKAPHQHSFVHGGVSVPVTSDNVNQALALIQSIKEFIKSRLITDTEIISRAYSDYYEIGVTPQRLLSFGLFKFGGRNQISLWPAGVLTDGNLTLPNIDLISEDISHSWFIGENEDKQHNTQMRPDPYKPGAYTWVKSVKYGGKTFQGGPLVRMILLGRYRGGTSTMDRIYARSLEALYISELIEEWLHKLKPGPAPINQKKEPILKEAVATTDAMRGPLLHRTQIQNEQIVKYNILTPTMWNFSPKDQLDQRGPAENALVGTVIPKPHMLFTILGRIIRSFDPCLACATHAIDFDGNTIGEIVI